jgi:hypothetical protein
LFFAVSKTVGYLGIPSTFLIGIGLLGAILLLTRFARFGRRLMVASLLLLAICGFSPLANFVLYPLEQRFRNGTLRAASLTASSCSAGRSRPISRRRTACP